MYLSKGVGDLYRQCQEYALPCLVPDQVFLTPPGGPLKYMVTAHENGLNGLGMSRDALYVVTCKSNCMVPCTFFISSQFLQHALFYAVDLNTGSNTDVKVWDMQEGSHLRTVENLGTNLGNLCLCCEDKYIVCTSEGNRILVLRFDTGEVVNEIKLPKLEDGDEDQVWFENNEGGLAPCGKGKCQIAILANVWVVVYDVETGRKLWQLRDTYLRGDAFRESYSHEGDFEPCEQSYIIGEN